MASSTRWRIYTHGNNATTWTSDLQVTEVEMHASIGGADVCTGGTATADSFYGVGNEASKAFDDSLATMWRPTSLTGKEPHWLEYEFATAQEIVEYSINVCSASNLPATGPRFWWLEYWDGSKWVAVDFRYDQGSWGATETRVFTVNSATPPLNQCYGGTASASDYLDEFVDPDYFPPAKAFQGSQNSYPWLSATDNTGWLEYDFGAGREYIITEYWMRPKADVSLTGVSQPKNWTFQYYDGAVWQTVDTQTGAAAWSVGEWRYFTFSNIVGAQRWRINVSELQDPTRVVEIARLQMFGALETPIVTTGTIDATENADTIFLAVSGIGSLGATEAPDTPYFVAHHGGTVPAMDANFTLPMLSMVGGMQNLVLPMLTATGEVLTGNVTRHATINLPDLTVAAAMLNGGMCSSNAALPMLDVQADFGINAVIRLTRIVTSGSVLSGSTLRANSLLPRLTVTAGLVSDGIASVDVSIPSLTLAANILVGSSMSVSAVLPRLALAISGYSGSVTTASISLPAFTVSGEIWGEYIGHASLELPMLTLVATFADRITTTTTAFAMNAKTAGLTQYSNFNFNSAANFNGVDLVASASGIFALGGALDDTSVIDAYARLGTTDFGTAVHKRVKMAYLGYRSDGTMRLRVITDEQETYDYTVPSTDSNGIHGNRCKMGRGMKGTYWQFELGNVDGASFEIDSLQLVAQPLSRKVY